jgi:hypothetical protein
MAYNRQPQTVLAGLALKQNPPPTVIQPAGIIPVTLDAAIATKNSLGVVQIGKGIDVTPGGVISVKCDKCDDDRGCNTILVGENYGCESDDCYIGVHSLGPVTISLPVDCGDGHQIAVKAEMGPPLGNRKVTIKTLDGSLIDGSPTFVLSVPYQSVHLIRRGLNWHII